MPAAALAADGCSGEKFDNDSNCVNNFEDVPWYLQQLNRETVARHTEDKAQKKGLIQAKLSCHYQQNQQWRDDQMGMSYDSTPFELHNTRVPIGKLIDTYMIRDLY